MTICTIASVFCLITQIRSNPVANQRNSENRKSRQRTSGRSAGKRRRSRKRGEQNRNQSSKVIRLNKAFQINAALIIFGIIFLYVLFNVILTLRKEPVATYKVNSSNINNNISCEGIALREEKEIAAGKSGYVCYYVRDGERVAKGAPICTIDETGTLLQSVSMVPEGTSVFSAADYLEVRNSIDIFKSGYSDNSFYQVYQFRNSIESKVLEMSNQIMMKEYRTQGTAVQSTVENMVSPNTGIITYYIDHYEKLTPEMLTAEHFDRSKYDRKIFKAGDIVESGNTIYKLIDNEEWTVCCKITIDQANTLLDENKLYYTINNSEIQIASNYDLIRSEDFYVLVLLLNRYMIDYVEERFLSVEIILDSYEGLKVPNTAFTEKSVYKVPKEYMTAGGNESSYDKLYVEKRDENGEMTVRQIQPSIYRTDEEYFYVGTEVLSDEDVLKKPDSTETLPVSTLDRDKLKGVYLANKGIADFVEISMLRDGDEFSIVKYNNGLREFDNIVMDASKVLENQILY